MVRLGPFNAPVAQLVCAWLTLFVVGTDLFIISPLLPQIGAEFGTSAASTGLGVTVFSLAYLLSAPLLGYIADRTGRRRTLIACLAGFAAANLLTGIASGMIGLLTARLAAGATAAGVSPLIYAGVSEAAPPPRRATWMAIAVSGLLLALSVGAPAGTIGAFYFGWRAPFLLLGLLSIALIAANRLAWPAGVSPGAKPDPAQPDLRLATILRRLLPTVLWATALYGVYTYLGAWLSGADRTPSQIASAFVCYGIGALVGTLLGGQAADRVGSRVTMMAGLAGLATGLCVLAADIGTGWTADTVLLLTSAFAQLFFPAQQAGLACEFARRRAFVLALNNSALFLGISVGSVVGGEAITRAGFSVDAVTGAGIAGLALLLVAAAERPKALDTHRPAILPGRLPETKNIGLSSP